MVVVYFVIVIFVLVTVHEFGHFIAGRIFGMHVPVFSVGMGRRVLGWNKINGFTLGPLKPEVEEKLGVMTDYRLSLIPMGGYAKIDGMIDETQTEELSPVVQPWEFRAKSWWKKAIVLSAGVTMNILLAIAIFSFLRWHDGKTIMLTTKIGYVAHNSASERLGIHEGDEILSVNGKAVHDWQDIDEEVIFKNIGRDITLTYARDGQTHTAVYTTTMLRTADPDSVDKQFGMLPIGFGAPKVDSVTASEGAEHAGIRHGDVIVAINGEAIVNGQSLIDHVESHPNENITVNWRRDTTIMSAAVKTNPAGHIGVAVSGLDYRGPKRVENYSIPQSVKLGLGDVGSSGALLGKTIWLVVTGKLEAKKAIGGPIKIAAASKDAAEHGFSAFLNLMALLSVSLAFLNILPVPALDGGHLLIITIEAAIRRELSQKIKLGFQKVGVVALLMLMAFIFFNDFRSVLMK